MYGLVAEDHLKSPRNLGKLADPDGVGRVDDSDSETLLTVYLKLHEGPDGRPIVGAASFRAFGCGGCIITGSVATELAIGRPLDEISDLDAAAINRAIQDGLPPDQRYCADLASRALRMAAEAATGERRGTTA